MPGQVTPQRLAAVANEPQNWSTYSGNLCQSVRVDTLDLAGDQSIRFSAMMAALSLLLTLRNRAFPRHTGRPTRNLKVGPSRCLSTNATIDTSSTDRFSSGVPVMTMALGAAIRFTLRAVPYSSS